MRTRGLRREAGGPMYQQLRQDLLARIRRGEFGPGSVLPSENQLCEDYGVSVTTARRAFLELVKEGVVHRKAGVGTIVASEVRRAQINFVSIDYVGDSWRQYSNVMGEMIGGVSEYAWNHDATLSILGVKDEEAATYLRGLVEDRATDGVLMRVANDVREEHVELLEQAGLPYVVIKRRIPGRKMNYVNSDDVAGARMATSHLLDLGHRRIGFVCAKPHISIGQERLGGYKEALEERGVSVDEELIRTEPYFTQEMGYKATRSLMELPEPPSAVFVASDTMAVGGYEALQELGLRIPEDISVVGYDDVALAATLRPPLTTVRTSFYEFGQLATQLLLELVEGRASAPQARWIHPRLVVRSSTQPPELDSEEPVAVSLPDPRLRETGGDRLEGKVIAHFGSGRETDRAIQRGCELEGAVVLETSASGTYGIERAEGVLISVDLQEGLGHALGDALGCGRQALSQMPQGRGGGMVVLATLYRLGTPSGQAELEAARAGVSRIVRELAAGHSSVHPRVNGLLVVRDTDSPAQGLTSLGGLLSLLLSEECQDVSGQTIVSGGRGELV